MRNHQKFLLFKRITAVTAAVTTCTVLLAGCSWLDRLMGKGDKEPTTLQATATAEPTATPVPKTAKELIVGKWNIDHFEDNEGHSMNLSDIDTGSIDLSVLETAVESGASLEFTEEGKIKVSVLTVNYEFQTDSTMKISGRLLPQEFADVPVSVENDTAKIGLGDTYKLVLKRAEA